jgi:hypothetical protein
LSPKLGVDLRQARSSALITREDGRDCSLGYWQANPDTLPQRVVTILALLYAQPLVRIASRPTLGTPPTPAAATGSSRAPQRLILLDRRSRPRRYRTPKEVMAQAEPVIRAVLPGANVPTSIRSSGVPVVHGSASDLGSVLDTWLAAHADGIACVISTHDIEAGTFRATSRVRSLTPELSKGLEFDLVVLIDAGQFGDGVVAAFGNATSGIEAAVDMTRATRQLVILTSS